MVILHNDQVRWLKGYEGKYAVTSDGEVWSMPREGTKYNSLRRLVPQLSRGYLYASLWDSDAEKIRRRPVHHLVLEAFVGNRPAGMEACHNNGMPKTIGLKT